VSKLHVTTAYTWRGSIDTFQTRYYIGLSGRIHSSAFIHGSSGHKSVGSRVVPALAAEMPASLLSYRQTCPTAQVLKLIISLQSCYRRGVKGGNWNYVI